MGKRRKEHTPSVGGSLCYNAVEGGARHQRREPSCDWESIGATVRAKRRRADILQRRERSVSRSTLCLRGPGPRTAEATIRCQSTVGAIAVRRTTTSDVAKQGRRGSGRNSYAS